MTRRDRGAKPARARARFRSEPGDAEETPASATGPGAIDCEHGELCGACALLGRSYPQQLGRKRRVLTEALRAYRSLARAEVLPCLASPVIEGYRNRAKMAVGISRYGPPSVGYFRGGTREIVDATECRILVPEVLETTRALRRFIERGTVPRQLRHVDVRCGSDPRRQHLTLVLRSEEMPSLPLDSLQRACKRVDGISVNLNPQGGAQVIKGRIEPLWGAREIYVETAGLALRVSPGSFFQVNLHPLEAIHASLREFLAGGTALADLYAGVGTHGLALRDGFRRVLCVEGVRSAVADAKATIKHHRLSGVTVLAKPVERSLKAIEDVEADRVVMNPSRAGAKPAVLEMLARSPAERLAYLSCDPATLCRDLDILVRSGFRLQSVEPIDMMPQTRQVEALALLTRR